MTFTVANFRRYLRRSGAVILPSVPPANTAAPTVSGNVLTGDALIMDDGSWSNNPTAFERKWQAAPGPSYTAWVDIPGATTGIFRQTAAQEAPRSEVASGASMPPVRVHGPTARPPPSCRLRRTSIPMISSSPARRTGTPCLR